MFANIKFILEILPSIIKLIRDLEVQFPESGLGKMKLSLVVETIQGTLGNAVSSENLALVKKVIDSVVSVFNTFGIFKK